MLTTLPEANERLMRLGRTIHYEGRDYQRRGARRIFQVDLSGEQHEAQVPYQSDLYGILTDLFDAAGF